jgi:hypothetical protein
VGAAGSRVPWSPRERSHGVAIIGAIQKGAMPTKRRPDRVQFEDHGKWISRRLVARRRKRNASGSRHSHEAADKLIQFQQQNRMAAGSFGGAGTKRSVTPDRQTRIECRPVPSKFQLELDRGIPPGAGGSTLQVQPRRGLRGNDSRGGR